MDGMRHSHVSFTTIWRKGIAALSIIILIALFYQHTRWLPSTARTGLDDVEIDIYNATLGFEKIFVLNLPERTDHADWMKLSAGVSDIKLDFVDGVVGARVLDKVIPYPADRTLGDGNIGSWRAHMNAMARIVAENITSALIMEDDIDWDIRIKQQMRDFSRGTRALIQPLRGSAGTYADPTLKEKRPPGAQQKHGKFEDDKHFDIYSSLVPDTVKPTMSPYGDDWDVLWPGHCSVSFPRSMDSVPHGRYIMLDEETMIGPEVLRVADPMVLPGSYPPYTRIVHHVWDPVCTFAYAVSQRGARKILYEYGIKRLDRAFDNMMVDFCDSHVCLTTSPQLFSAYRAAGPVNRDSEINGFGQDRSEEIRDKGSSENIQQSVRLNIEAILNNEPAENLQDQYPRS